VWGYRAAGFIGYGHRGRAIFSYARAVATSRQVHAMTLPEGLIYVPGFLTEAEERDVRAVLATFELQQYVLHDTPSRRQVRSFGLGRVIGARPWPGGIDPRRAGVAPGALRRADGTRTRGSGELARDALPARCRDRLAPRCAGVREVSDISLLTACRMRFRRGRPRAWETAELTLEPRSAYVLSGPARTQWEHHIPPVAEERWSMTFRTLRRASAGIR
jgi:hypothetical protein